MSNDSPEHRFADPDLLRQALTHRSAGARNNERFEFLGDALLNLIVADALFRSWTRADEGVLTRARAELVRESALAKRARTLRLGERLRLGPGEMKSGGHRRDSILADALEALVAAIYLDAGFEACRDAVLSWFQPDIDALLPGKVAKDAKTRLQEILQARQSALPEYILLESEGEDHARTFRVRCVVKTPEVQADGEGSSRRAAEQQAATEVLRVLEAANG